jgi:hypothetical protein
MFLGLEVLVYNIKLGSPCVLESNLDYDFYILPIYVSLNHFFLLFLGRSPEVLLLSFTPLPLHKTFIILYI